MTEHVCSRKDVPSTKNTFHFGILWNPYGTLRHNGNYHIWRPPRGTFQGKDHQQVYSPLLRLPAPEFRQWRELGQYLQKTFTSPEATKLMVGRGNHIKIVIHTEKRDLSSNLKSDYSQSKSLLSCSCQTFQYTC